MAIAAQTIADYAPWGNAELAFELPTGVPSTDPATGNAVLATETVEYLAALALETPNWQPASGIDTTLYLCRGRLLSPAVLDTRIQNGSQATAVINGTRGRFELVIDLAMDAAHRSDLRQTIQGTFRVLGGGG